MVFFQHSRKSSRSLALALVAIAAVIFTADIMIPLGVASGIAYAVVVLLAAWLYWPAAIWVVAVMTSCLVGVGYLLSPETDEVWKAIVNRGLSLFVIWGAAILLSQRRIIDDRLEMANERLERWATDRDARLKGVLRYVPEAIVIIDEHGAIDSINDAAEKIFRYSAEALQGRNVSILMPEPYQSRHGDYIAEYFQSGKGRIIDTGPREIEGLRSDGSLVPLELSIGPMGNRMFIGVARDISERKRVEAQLQHANKMKSLGQLTSGIAHDFNNLLTVILGNLEILQDELEADEATNEYLHLVERAGQRAVNLTARLLAYARRQILQPERVEVARLVREAVELMGRTLGEDVDIETFNADDLWDVFVDRGQLEDCLLNLALNARDAMPRGGKLTIETANMRLDREYARNHEEVKAGDYVMIAVTDNGEGIPPDIMDRIFDPFFTTRDKSEGTGLGLSMVYGFIKQSGGHIKAYSEPGQGTTMKLYLPRSKIDQDYEQNDEPVESGGVGSEVILVVEDDADVRNYVTRVLESLGYSVLIAADGPSAMELLPSLDRLDMLLTDVIMPGGMNGRQVADGVLGAFPDISVLFMSGYTENAVVHHGVLDSNVELLMKPYTRNQLARTVRAMLDQHKAGQTLPG